MPLHLQAIMKDDQRSKLIAWILQEGMNECDTAFVSPDGLYFHIQRYLVDEISSSVIGRLVYTIKNDEERKFLEILDIDIVFESDNPAKVRFLNLRDGSSDANEYYEIETVLEGRHLIVESVNRHTEPDIILGTERDVNVSIFPFSISIFEDISAFNKKVGVLNPIKVGDREFRIGGFDERFSMPIRICNGGESEDENYSFLIGKVKSFKDALVELGNFKIRFVLAQIDTALGVVPAVLNRENFDLTDLKEDCVMMMNGDVKADLAKPEQFRNVKPS